MKLTVKEITVFGMLGALMYASKFAMELLPNIHLLGVFTIAFTVVYRCKALYPIYIFVALQGLLSGFANWWIPYLYVWTVLWGLAMLLPKKMPEYLKPPVYMCLCSLHGFLYGVLYAPAQALFFGLSFKGMINWIVVGIPYDIIHGVSNLICGILIYPLVLVLLRAEKYTSK